MGRVFLSYARDDLRRAAKVAQALEAAGHEVWWDSHLKGGSEYSREIDEALKAAEAVVVLWSKTSVDSEWVRDEAAVGKQSGRLVPARIDATEPPLGFRQHHTIDLSGRGAAGIRQLVDTVNAKMDPGAVPAPAPKRRTIFQPGLALAAALALIVAAAAIFILWRNFAPKSAVPVVAITGADASPGSRAMAHELLVKLGSLQAARADAVQLTEHQAGGEADLTFAVGGSNDGQVSRASLVMFDGRTQDLLWSKDFELPRSQQADLQQQVAFTAGRALECALEALAGERTGLSRPVLKLYLNGCTTIDELAYGNLHQLIPTFRQVTTQAPKFEGGWAKLVQVEVFAASNNPSGDPALKGLIKKHIAEARKVNPHLAEAYLAEVELLAPTDHAARLRLVDLAAEHNPTHPEPFAARAYYLRFVGRMNESVESAKRASELDPLSPAIRYDYISALTNAGQFDRARHELEQAERLWPGSSAVRSARFFLQRWYGDPKDALRLLRAGASSDLPQLTESFLRARIDPTLANIEAAVQQARAHFQRDPSTIAVLAQVLGAFDREEELFSLLLDHGRTINAGDVFSVALFRPVLRDLRRDPRFMRVAKRLGLIAYWQKSGKWPDFCFEPDLPYDCKKEAGKLGA